MSSKIQHIQSALGPVCEKIIHHPVYQLIDSLDGLRIFMRYHVYAVWDFMSLLKALQNSLTCTSVPWFPVGSGKIRALINEIVAGEESDLDANGEQKSHFEMYLEAMEQCGANTSEIRSFLDALKNGQDLEDAFQVAGTPQAARDFVRFTFEVIASGNQHVQAAAFTFGREDLIPGMFHALVSDLNQKFPGQLDLFKYYLDRHIAVDGDQHSHLALEMTSNLCADDDQRWHEAEVWSYGSLNQRVALWNGVQRDIMNLK